MSPILLFLKPTPKKLILPLVLVFVPMILLYIGNISGFTPFMLLGFIIMMVYEFLLGKMNELFDLNMVRNCQGGGWLSFCYLYSTTQGFILISIVFGIIGYLFSCLIFRTRK